MFGFFTKVQQRPYNLWGLSAVSEVGKGLKERVPRPSFPYTGAEVKGKLKALPGEIFGFVRSGPLTRIILQVAGIASKCFSLEGAKGASAVPYIGLVTSPIYLVNALIDTYGKIKVMIQALRTGQYSEAAFMGGGALGSIDSAVGAVSTSLAGSASLAGIKEVFEPAALLFDVVMPILSMATGALGIGLEGWGLKRNVSALSDFNKQLKTAEGDEQKLKALLAFLQGEEVPDDTSTKKEKIKYQVKHEFFVNDRFTSEKRFKELKGEIEALLEGFNAEKCDEVMGMVKGEMHRRMLYHLFGLITSMIGLSAGMLYFIAPEYQMISIYMWAGSAAIDIGLIIFDKTISTKRFAKMDQWLSEVAALPLTLLPEDAFAPWEFDYQV